MRARPHVRFRHPPSAVGVALYQSTGLASALLAWVSREQVAPEFVMSDSAGSPADAPPRDKVAESCAVALLVHDESTKLVELARVLHALGEHVSRIVGGAYEWYLDLEGFDHVTHEEVAALHVLHAVVMLRVV